MDEWTHGASRTNQKYLIKCQSVRQADGSPSRVGVITTCAGSTISREDVCAKVCFTMSCRGLTCWRVQVQSGRFWFLDWGRGVTWNMSVACTHSPSHTRSLQCVRYREATTSVTLPEKCAPCLSTSLPCLSL